MSTKTKLCDDLTLYNGCRSSSALEQQNAYEQLSRYLYKIVYPMTWHLPDGDAFAKDCIQDALIRIHGQIESCLYPESFCSWSWTIAYRHTLNQLKRNGRQVQLGYDNEQEDTVHLVDEHNPTPEQESETKSYTESLMGLLANSPMSERSMRVVIGKYLEEKKDEQLAAWESQLANRLVLPSNIQVTRSKT